MEAGEVQDDDTQQAQNNSMCNVNLNDTCPLWFASY